HNRRQGLGQRNLSSGVAGLLGHGRGEGRGGFRRLLRPEVARQRRHGLGQHVQGGRIRVLLHGLDEGGGGLGAETGSVLGLQTARHYRQPLSQGSLDGGVSGLGHGLGDGGGGLSG